MLELFTARAIRSLGTTFSHTKGVKDDIHIEYDKVRFSSIGKFLNKKKLIYFLTDERRFSISLSESIYVPIQFSFSHNAIMLPKSYVKRNRKSIEWLTMRKKNW